MKPSWSIIVFISVLIFMVFISFYATYKDENLTIWFYAIIVFISFAVSYVVTRQNLSLVTKFLITCILFVSILELYIFSMPIGVLSNYPSFYRTLYLVDKISKEGYLTNTYMYEAYPAVLLLGSVLNLIAYPIMDNYLFLKIFPSILFILSVSLLLNRRERYTNVAFLSFFLLIFSPLSLKINIAITPAMFGSIFLIYSISILQRLISTNSQNFSRQASYIIVLMLILVVLANITYATLMAIFLVIYTLSITFFLVFERAKINGEVLRKTIRITVLFLVIFASWYIVSPIISTFTQDVIIYAMNSLKLMMKELSVETYYVTPTSPKPFSVIMIQYAAFGMFGVFWMKSFFDKRISHIWKLFALSGLISAIFFMGFWFFGAPEGTDLFARGLLIIYLTSTPMLPYHISHYFANFIKSRRNATLIIQKVLIISFLTLTILNACFYGFPPYVYDFTTPLNKEDTRFNLSEWIVMGDFLETHSNVNIYYGVRLATNLIGARKFINICEYEQSVNIKSPDVIPPEKMASLHEITPNAYHILRRSMQEVPEWSNKTLKDLDTIISKYNILYISEDAVLIKVDG